MVWCNVATSAAADGNTLAVAIIGSGGVVMVVDLLLILFGGHFAEH